MQLERRCLTTLPRSGSDEPRSQDGRPRSSSGLNHPDGPAKLGRPPLRSSAP